ncbi:MAG: hypothetical protein ACXVJ7_06895 [Acidimicrobiia bacterium]
MRRSRPGLRSRWHALVAAVGVGAVVLIASSASGDAASRNRADLMLDRSRDAVRTHEFRAVVRVTWWDSGGAHRTDVPVVASDGAVHIAGGSVLGDDGRAWMRSGHHWSAVWTDRRDPRAPSIGAKYSMAVSAGPTLLSRPTRMLVVTQSHRVAERLIFDRALGLVLRRDLYDGDGRPTLSTEFVSLEDVHTRTGSFRSPTVSADAPTPLSDSGGPTRIGDGFVLVGTQKVGDETQRQYTDGVFDASVFSRDATLDWEKLPRGGADARYGSVRVRRYRSAEGTVLTWQSGNRTFTCVTDAPEADQLRMVESLTPADDDAVSDVARFLVRPFRWV